MNILKLFTKEKKKRFSDVHQELLNNKGKEQFTRLLQKGLQIPIVLL